MADEERGRCTPTCGPARLKLLYVAPERFANERFLANARARCRISLFAVDEAHCICEWGHNFRPDYLKLAALARELGAERVLALTATATPAVVAGHLPRRSRSPSDDVGPHRLLPAEPDAAHDAVSARDQADRAARPIGLRSRPPGPTIVYVTLQRTAEEVAERRSAAGLPGPRVSRRHGGRRCAHAVQDWFMASDARHRRRDDRLRHGHRQGEHPLRLPLQPAQEPGELRPGDRPGRPRRRRSTCELFACAEDVPALENFAYGDTPTPEARGGAARRDPRARQERSSTSPSTSSPGGSTSDRSC